LVKVFGKPNCCVCDTADFLLRRIQLTLPFRLEKVDITKEASLYERYKEAIPVIVVDGVEASRLKIDSKALRRRLTEATAAAGAGGGGGPGGGMTES